MQGGKTKNATCLLNNLKSHRIGASPLEAKISFLFWELRPSSPLQRPWTRINLNPRLSGPDYGGGEVLEPQVGGGAGRTNRPERVPGQITTPGAGLSRARAQQEGNPEPDHSQPGQGRTEGRSPRTRPEGTSGR